MPQAVSDLTLEQRGDQLILRFAYPRTTTAGQALPGLDRIEIFELARPAMRPVPPAEAEEAETEPEVEAETEAATEIETGEPEAPAAETPQPAPADPIWIPPPVNARDFSAAATLRSTLQGTALDSAVRGDRLVVEIDVPETAGTSPGLEEPPAAHYFAVRSVARGDYASAFSNRPAIIPATPPRPPRGLELTPRADGVAVSWTATANAGLEGYNVYRRPATERDFTAAPQPVRGERTELTDRQAQFGERYFYAVTAVVSRRPLIESAIAEAGEVHYRDSFPPPAPTGLVALADESGIRLLWNESDADDLAGYRLSRRTGTGPWEALTTEPIADLDYQDATAQPGIEYGYRVTAVDELGNESGVAEEATTTIPLPTREPAAGAPDAASGS